jgi:hypothetical protein
VGEAGMAEGWQESREQYGIDIPKFIDDCVVGMSECGRRPSEIVDPIKMISEINKWSCSSFGVRISTICLVISWISC